MLKNVLIGLMASKLFCIYCVVNATALQRFIAFIALTLVIADALYEFDKYLKKAMGDCKR